MPEKQSIQSTCHVGNITCLGAAKTNKKPVGGINLVHT